MKIVLWIGIAIGSVLLLFLLWKLFDRFCLFLEARGLLFYKNKQSSSSAASAMVGLQKFIEPGTRHVIEAKQKLIVKKEESGDPDDPPQSFSGNDKN